MTIDDVWRVDAALTSAALSTVERALELPESESHLASYYKSDSNYAGSTFLCLEPNDPMRVIAADLLAVTTLSVSIHPRAIRSFEENAGLLASQLADLDPAWRIEEIDPGRAAVPMSRLYETVKKCLTRAGAKRTNAWVTASKICARKRPDLFPVRDNIVLELLGLPKNYPVDWPVFQAVMASSDLMAQLDARVLAASSVEGVVIGDPGNRLRHLDVVLWMHAVTSRRRLRVSSA